MKFTIAREQGYLNAFLVIISNGMLISASFPPLYETVTTAFFNINIVYFAPNTPFKCLCCVSIYPYHASRATATQYILIMYMH